MKKIAIAASLLFAISSCNVFRYAGHGTISTDNFKTEIPFRIEKDMAIVVPIGFGPAGEQYRFHFDTHAPEASYSAGSKLAARNFKYLGSSGIKVRTTSGEQFDRKYFEADSVYMGNVLATGVSFIQMPEDKARAADTTYPSFDGILGVSLLRHGVWKIDFDNNVLTFASSMDSLANTAKILFAKSNVFDIFKTEATFDGLQKNMEVDLGANISIMLPLADMKKLKNFDHAEIKQGTRRTAAGTSATTSYRLSDEPVSINNQSFAVKIAGAEGFNTPVIGLNFFRQFKYIILDYPNGKLYVSGANVKLVNK